MLKEVHRNRMVHFAESLSEAMFKFTNLVMYFAPIAVFAAISYSVGNMGIGILGNLLQLLATLYVSLIIFLAGVLLPIALLMKIPVRNFIRAVSEPATIAFATTSSESALPIAMETMEKWYHALSFAGYYFCGAMRGYTSAPRSSAPHCFYANAYQQRRCRGFEGFAGYTAGHGSQFRVTNLAYLYNIGD
jgi:hypothetical protein